MSSMDGDSSFEEHVPLCEQPQWHGLPPVDLPEGHVVAIQYTPDHREAIAYFRAVIEQGEYSERALALTADLISYNQADYTAWEWRWRCLQALHKDLATEYIFTDGIMHDNAKNYQLWNHRRKCGVALGAGAAARELAVAADALQVDAKNYHAWAHRQLMVKEFGGVLWEQELAYCEEHISSDIRNNSAWNQRAFIVHHQLTSQAAVVVTGDTPHLAAGHGPLQAVPTLTRDLMARELDYAAAQVARAPRNESAWNYLRGLFSMPGLPPHAIAMFEEVAVICREALIDAPSCPCALDVYAEYYLHLAYLHLQLLQTTQAHLHAPDPAAGVARSAEDLHELCQGALAGLQAAVGCCVSLMDALMVADPVRTLYWQHRAQGAQQLLLVAGVAAGTAEAGPA